MFLFSLCLGIKITNFYKLWIFCRLLYNTIIMSKGKSITIIILLSVIMLATAALAALAICDYARQNRARQTAIIKFDTDGGEELYPWTVAEDLNYQYFCRPYKANSVFLGWEYEGKYIEEYEAETFKKPGVYVFKAKWKPVDSIEESVIKNALMGAEPAVTDLFLEFTRNGYKVNMTLQGENFKKWYECGITALDLLNDFKENHSDLDEKILEYNISFCQEYNYFFNASYLNAHEGSVETLTNFSNNYGNAVSLLTREGYVDAKNLLES